MTLVSPGHAPCGSDWLMEGPSWAATFSWRAALDGLGLEAAGIRASPEDIEVDRRRRTRNPHVSVIGDCGVRSRFTLAVGHEGSLAVMAIGFGLPVPMDYVALPAVIYTAPGLAQLGLT